MKPSQYFGILAICSQSEILEKYLGSGLKSGFWDFLVLKLQSHWAVLW